MNELNNANYKELVKSDEKPVAVMVKANWCPKCKALAPVFEKTAAEMSETADFHYLTVDDNRALAKSIKIMGVPTMLFYRHGVLITKKLGTQSPKTIKNVIQAMANLTPKEASDQAYRSFFSRIFGKT